MARPTRRERSSRIQFRERIPLDVLDQVRGRELTIPVGESVLLVRVGSKAKEIYLSLRTPDPIEAKARHSAVQSHLANVYRGLRSSTPVGLSHAECVALSGDFYLAWAKEEMGSAVVAEFADVADTASEVAGDEPSPAENLWLGRLRELNELRVRGDLGSSAYGRILDRYLFNKGLRITLASRGMLLTEVARALSDAFEKQKRNAGGDYAPDLTAQRFPTAIPLTQQLAGSPSPSEKSGTRLTFDVLLTHWEKARSPAPGSVAAFRNAVANLKKHLDHNDPLRVTKADIRGWRDALRDDGRSAKTVNDSYLALVRTLYRRARKDELLSFDPVEDIRDETKRKAGSKPLPYDDDEVAAILALADNETKAHLHWVPWLVAFTGARVGEITQLWGKHVKCIDGVHVISITPTDDGGQLKNEGSERDVPLHPAIIARGFLKFVEGRKGGPLFYGGEKATPRPRKPGAVRHASKGPANRVATWIREKGFTNTRKAPNHAFRHWFKSVCPEFGIFDSQANALQGHAGNDGEADKYRHRRLKALYTAMCRLEVPRLAQNQQPEVSFDND